MDDAVGDKAPVGKSDLLMRNLRQVLVEEGFTGEALENKITEIAQKDHSRLASVILAPRHS
jgi:hypothetical protein